MIATIASRSETRGRHLSETVHKCNGGYLQLGRNNFEDEVNRRIQLGWVAFGKLTSSVLTNF
jgi:hypothetical protein